MGRFKYFQEWNEPQWDMLIAFVIVFVGVLLIVGLYLYFGFLSFVFSIPISAFSYWMNKNRSEWREEQRRKGADPDAEWRPWLLKSKKSPVDNL